MKKVIKTNKNVKTTKKTIVKKAALKITKTTSKLKTVPAKKTVKKPLDRASAAKKPAVKKLTVKPPKKTAKKPVSTKKPIASKPADEKSVPEKKPAPAPVQPNLGLPDGSEYQQTGLRRPLIVFPK